jgi:hypothetical protein
VTAFDETLSTYDIEKLEVGSVKLYPNPVVDEKSYISFKIRELSTVKLEVFDQQGKLVHTIINDVEMEYGKHVIPVDLYDLNLRAGTYYSRLSINGESKTMKTILIK